VHQCAGADRLDGFLDYEPFEVTFPVNI
jgi:hypothetical protein